MTPTPSSSLRHLHIEKPEHFLPAYLTLAPLVQLEKDVLDEVLGRPFQFTTWPPQLPTPPRCTLSLPHLRHLDMRDMQSF